MLATVIAGCEVISLPPEVAVARAARSEIALSAHIAITVSIAAEIVQEGTAGSGAITACVGGCVRSHRKTKLLPHVPQLYQFLDLFLFKVPD